MKNMGEVMDSEVQVQSDKPQRSTFVSVVAWIFIVISGFATFISILQNIMFHTLFPREEMNQAFQHTEQGEQIPAVVNFMFNHFDLLLIFFWWFQQSPLSPLLDYSRERIGHA